MINNQIIQEFKKELEEIKSDLRKEIKLKNPKIKFNDYVYKNYYSKGHLLCHVGIAVTESIGIGLLYVCTAVSGLRIAIGIHVVIVFSNIVYDKSKEK